MKVIKQQNDDLIIGNNPDIFLHGKEAVAQLSRDYALTLLGEMPLKMNRGIPYFQIVLGDYTNLKLFEHVMRKRMEEIPQVVAVESFDAEKINGVVRYTMTLKTNDGNIEISERV